MDKLVKIFKGVKINKEGKREAIADVVVKIDSNSAPLFKKGEISETLLSNGLKAVFDRETNTMTLKAPAINVCRSKGFDAIKGALNVWLNQEQTKTIVKDKKTMELEFTEVKGVKYIVSYNADNDTLEAISTMEDLAVPYYTEDNTTLA